jgi:hypothetical protein
MIVSYITIVYSPYSFIAHYIMLIEVLTKILHHYVIDITIYITIIIVINHIITIYNHYNHYNHYVIYSHIIIYASYYVINVLLTATSA